MKYRGFTLLDLLGVVAIIIVLTGVGVPSIANLVERARADRTAHTIYRAFQNARTHAINNREVVTVCGSNDGANCARKWGKYLLVFVDRNDNGTCDDDERLGQRNLGFSGSPITTKLALGRSYTRIKSNGAVSLQGSMVYCPENRKSVMKRITWNQVGRPYLGRDVNGDGIVDSASGDDLSC